MMGPGPIPVRTMPQFLVVHREIIGGKVVLFLNRSLL